jgi:hypothetical protein
MLIAGLLAVFLASASRALADDAPPAAPAQSMPEVRLLLKVIGAARSDVRPDGNSPLDRLPVATLVALAAPPERTITVPFGPRGAADAWTTGLPAIGAGSLLTDYADGMLKPVPPNATQDTALLLAGPVLDTGMRWTPVELRLDQANKVLTVVAERWTDTAPRRKNVPGRELVALLVGRLPAGQYTLRVVDDEFRCEVEKSPRYHWVARREAAKAVAVTAAPDLAGALVELNAADLTPVALPAEAAGRDYPQPTFGLVVHRVIANGKIPPGPRLGNFSLEKLDAQVTRPAPDAARPAGALNVRPVAATRGDAALLTDAGAAGQGGQAEPPLRKSLVIVGPEFNSGEQMSLRAIYWQKDTLTAVVDVWTDTAGRNLNSQYQPLLLIPLDAAAGEKPQVTVQWRSLVAPNPGRLYELKPSPRVANLPTKP